MAKTINPLNSQQAKGHLSRVLTYYWHDGRNYVLSNKRRRGLFVRIAAGFGRMYYGSSFFGFDGYRTGKNKTQLQSKQRYLFSYGWREYANLSNEEKIFYEDLGKKYGLTGPQIFLRQILN